MCDAAVREGVAACPFLRRVAATQGEDFALRLAINPLKPVVECGPSSPLFPEEAMSFQSAFSLFHGTGGVMPLAPARTAKTTGVCPRAQPKAQPSRASNVLPAPLPALVGLPVASMSISGFGKLPDPSEFLKRLRQRRDAGRKGRSSRGARAGGPHRGLRGSGGSGGIKGRGHAPRLSAGKPAGGGSACPLRALGPLAALIPTTASGHLRCPTAITRMRAFVAGLGAVRDLRPQALPVRGAALAAVAALGNVPAGAAREHTTKFSPAWFAAVHVAVPFVAMLRKAVLLPNWALALTIAGSVAGQVAGSRLERARLAGTLDLGGALAALAALGALPEACEGRDEESVWPAFAHVSQAAVACPPPPAVAA